MNRNRREGALTGAADKKAAERVVREVREDFAAR